MNTFIKASLIRAIRTVCQAALALIPTSAMLSEVDWRLVVSTSILAGIVSVLTSIATGLPEVKYAEHLYMYHDEPADSEVKDEE